MGHHERGPGSFGRIFLFLLLCLFVVAEAIPAESAQRLAVARGVVVDQDGNPIEGVTVSMEYWYMGPRLSISSTGAGDRESINETSRRRSGNSRDRSSIRHFQPIIIVSVLGLG